MKVLPSSTFLHSFFSVPPRLNSITEFPTPFICLLAVFSLWTSSLCPCSFLVCQKTFSFVYFLNLSPKQKHQANAPWDQILYEVFCTVCFNLSPFFGRICGSTNLVRDLLTFKSIYLWFFVNHTKNFRRIWLHCALAWCFCFGDKFKK